MKSVLALAGLLLFGCASQTEPPASVLLVTIDTLRADAVGPGRPTPAINAFLDRARWYRRARTPVPLTLPAHLTLLSGLDPHEHGVHDNAAPRVSRERGWPLLAEEFRHAGFATAAFVSCAVLGPETGIDAGFERFDAPRFGPYGGGDLTAEERVAAALDWIRARPAGQRWFAWVHFFDPHSPYLAWNGDAKRAGAPAEASDADRYAAEVRRVDAAVERLLASVGPRTVVVMASDHGEGLGEHGEETHGNLCYSATMDVLLALRGPGIEPGTDDGVRGLGDVAPALRTLLGLPAKRRGLLGPPAGVSTGESLLSWRTHGWGQCFAATDGRFTLVETGPRLELFDRQTDPGETRPLDPAGRPAYERLDRALAALRATGMALAPEALASSLSPYGAARRPFSTYLPRGENLRLADPAARLAFNEAVHEAKLAMLVARDKSDRSGLDRAIATLEELGARDATSPAPWFYLSRARTYLARLTGERRLLKSAARAAEQAMARGYQVAPALFARLEPAAASGEPRLMREALRAAYAGGVAPDLECARLAFEIARRLEDPASREQALAILQRAELHATGARERSELHLWASALRR